MNELTETAGTREYSVIGKSLPRIDGFSKATGEARFTEDLSLPCMLHGMILRSPHPHARIIRIDTHKAEKLPGVKAVVKGKDTRGIRYGWLDNLPPDEYPLAMDKVRFIGDEVAAVAAISEDIAEEALSLIKVEYEVLPAVFDPIEAMKDGAPVLHEELVVSPEMPWEGLGFGERPKPLKVANNIAAVYKREHGDIEQGLREAEYIREDRFVLPSTAHGALEPHSILASFDSAGNLQVWVCNQGYDLKRAWLAAMLGMPMSKIRILKSYVGGAFGGKINLLSHEFVAALLSQKTGKPVKVTMSREEVFAACYQDHRMTINIKTGMKKNGSIVAQHIKTVVDAGAYRGSSFIALRLGYSKTSPVYNIPNVRHDGLCVYTDKSCCGPKRGHGTPQIVFAIESQLDMIANDLGFDPVRLRLQNARKEGAVLPCGDKVLSCGLTECIEQATESAGWEVKRGKQKNRGIGIGVSAAQSGTAVYPFGSTAMVKLTPEGSVTLFTGTIELGQASDTAMCQIVAEEMGVSLDDVSLVSADSELCSIDLGNYAMGGVHVTGEAVRRAAADAKRQLLEKASFLLNKTIDGLQIVNHRIHSKGDSRILASFSDILRAGATEENTIIGKGYCRGGPPREEGRFTDAYAFTAAVAEVEIDMETGSIRLLKVTIAHDSGTPINTLSIEGQIEGQTVMSQGDLFLEEILFDGGRVLNPSFLDYSLPESVEASKVRFIDIPTYEPTGPFGAKEAGECVRPSLMAAIANAIYHASGIRFNNIPITADKFLTAVRNSDHAELDMGLNI